MTTKKPELRKEKWQKIGIRAAIVVLGLLAFLLLMDKLVMPWYVKRGEVTVLPKVIGKPVDDAVRILKDAGYEPIKYETQFDEKAKEGTIIRQTPEGGDETKPGRKVYLIISGGKEMVIVPSLVGQSLKDARILLVRSNLELGKTDMAFTDSIATGVVFKQSPDPGAKISTDQRVNIVVSQGPKAGRVPVPNLTGISFNEAILRLGNAKLGVGNRSYVSSVTDRPGTVVDQSPKPDELVLEGTTVDLFIVEEKVPQNPANEN
ncbi:MAG: PASTA domain-containing protein [Bacteroidota bacterium]|nr:PASTA domain-containing protein [Bacteroidota bacterium]